ncbi:hypothetical protein ACJRO7_023092 [Eucalyptus globulus]|uniref:B box-type domain-containing protein n=1 Tax=Eucalyptus globulus TaxID=34317 RepID=A0ABD3KDI9_EUCGL
MHCESDQASLCWGCDEKVHGANFLVAKHARALLCHASGPRLGPTVLVFECCRRICDGKAGPGALGDGGGGGGGSGGVGGGEEEAEDYDDNDVNEVLDDDDYGDEDEDEEEVDEEVDDEEEEEEEEEDGEIQVVPWSCDSPPPAASSSTEGESTSRSIAVAGDGALRRNDCPCEDLGSDVCLFIPHQDPRSSGGGIETKTIATSEAKQMHPQWVISYQMVSAFSNCKCKFFPFYRSVSLPEI